MRAYLLQALLVLASTGTGGVYARPQPQEQSPKESEINAFENALNSAKEGAPDCTLQPYKCVTCGDPTLDDLRSAEERWAASYADNAFADASHTWKWAHEDPARLKQVVPANAATFVKFSSQRLWKGPVDWDCSIVGSACDTSVKCGDSAYPGSSMILSSFANLHNYHTSTYNSIKDAAAVVQGTIGNFAKGFSALDEVKSDVLTKIYIDLIGMGFGIITAGFFNSVLKESKFFSTKGNENSLGILKDSTNSLVTGSLNIAKHTVPSVAATLAAQNADAAMISVITQSWKSSLSKYLDTVFDGSDASVSLLWDTVKKGVWADNLFPKNAFTLERVMERTIYAFAIPRAWRANPRVHPVIVMQKGGRNSENPDSRVENRDAQPLLSNADADAARVMWENDYTFYVLDAHDCQDMTPYGCNRPKLVALQSASELKGSAWGGVTLDDMVVSSYQGWQLNGGKNGYVVPETSKHIDGKGGQGDFIFQNDVRTPGIISIPMCDVETVGRNWNLVHVVGNSKRDPCPEYPCCNW
ncbi:MAG: hypothetical protein M1832_002224 [Thelocarpon impressellum]|nr:MAG: hypothetical protein M1832_002224 [Thelocarpon impressellum]